MAHCRDIENCQKVHVFKTGRNFLVDDTSCRFSLLQAVVYNMQKYVFFFFLPPTYGQTTLALNGLERSE